MDTTKLATTDITRSSFAAMGGVLLSRVSGVARTIIVNASFGVSTALDAFNVAFRLPNSLRDLFADGALSAAFMTTLVEEKQKGLAQERQLIAIVTGFFITITLVLALIGVIFSQQILHLITQANFKLSGGLAIAVILFRFLIFYLPLTMLNAVVMAVLGVHEQNFRAMNGSLFLSIGMIVGALLLAPLAKLVGFYSVIGLAVGALLGAILQMCYQAYPLLKLGLISIPNFDFRVWFNYKPLRKILIQMAPRALGQGAMIIALSINTFFATQIGTGFLTYIVTAVTIIQVPIGLFGVATGFVTLPALTLSLAQLDNFNFSRLLVEGLKTSFWLATFTAFCFALLIVPFYVVLFQHGKIHFYDVIHNCIAISVYASGMILASGNKILINTLYALNATRQIIYNSIIYLVFNTLLNIFLVPRFGLIGIGLSFGAATSLDFWLNYFFINHYFHCQGFSGSAYQQSGKFFGVKIILLTVLSFVLSLSSVALITHFWQQFSLIFSLPLSFWLALIILLVGGAILTSIFVIAVIKFGPAHLQQLIRRRLT